MLHLKQGTVCDNKRPDKTVPAGFYFGGRNRKSVSFDKSRFFAQVSGSSRLWDSADCQRLAEGTVCFRGGQTGIRTGAHPLRAFHRPFRFDSRTFQREYTTRRPPGMLLGKKCHKLGSQVQETSVLYWREAAWRAGAAFTVRVQQVWSARHENVFSILLKLNFWNLERKSQEKPYYENFMCDVKTFLLFFVIMERRLRFWFRSCFLVSPGEKPAGVVSQVQRLPGNTWGAFHGDPMNLDAFPNCQAGILQSVCSLPSVVQLWGFPHCCTWKRPENSW